MWLGNRLRILSLLCFDGAIAVLCGLAAIRTRFGDDMSAVLNEQHVWWRLLLLAVVTMASFYLLDLYSLNTEEAGRTASGRWAGLFKVVPAVGQAVGLASLSLSLIFYF